MRLIEILLVLSSFILFFNIVFIKRLNRRIVITTSLIGAVILTMQLLLEGYRWQLFILYLLSFLFILKLLFYPKVQIKVWKPIVYLFRTTILFVMIASACLTVYMPVNPLPKPEGKYTTGTQTFHLIDKMRDESFTKENQDVRQFMMQIWYPAQNTNKGEAAFLFSQDKRTFQQYKEAYANAIGIPSFLFDYLKYIQTHSYEDAPIASSKESFPVVLLSHGLGTSRHLHVSQAEHLASNGYIVVAIDHTYIAAGSAFPDGTFAPFQAIDFEKRFFEMDNTYGDTLVKDLNSAINYLQQLHTGKISSSFQGKIDLKNIGVMGHSFGGAAAFHATQENSNIKAGINMDGSLYPINQMNDKLKPFLFIEDETFFSVRKNSNKEYFQIAVFLKNSYNNSK
ncbi:alpha/beta hydrolase family protein [Bacillus manliponensis]|uniref:alpha/beta hydrolase family protein n=1 Tax=Bacillus manliponensis TaxID=574376 RepID=UPI000690ADF3|nr:alpha/beta fold hydrolase [Bacillus manliponensis]